MPTDTTPQSDAQVFGFLARLWIAEIDVALLKNLQNESTTALYKSLGGFVPEGDAAELIPELEFEYCACFIGPKGHLPPHQSVVQHSHFQGDCLSSLNQFVEIIGLPESPLFVSYKSMPDHIGNLLAMMQRVCAFEASTDENVDAVKELKSQFFQQHLAWMPKYCEVAQRQTTSDFYKGLFIVTERFLHDFSQRLTLTS